jgi:hypothetical protein
MPWLMPIYDRGRIKPHRVDVADRLIGFGHGDFVVCGHARRTVSPVHIW